MPVRETDPPSGLRVTREVPAWGLITLVIGVGVQAIVLWAQVQSLGEKLTAVATAQQQTTAQLAEINRSLNTTNLKDLEHDLKIQSLTNRVSALENLYPRTVSSAATGPKP